MLFLQIGLTLGYFVLVSWLVIATFLNYAVKPYLSKGNYEVRGSVSWTYAVLWGLALTAPIAYGLILDPA